MARLAQAEAGRLEAQRKLEKELAAVKVSQEAIDTLAEQVRAGGSGRVGLGGAAAVRATARCTGATRAPAPGSASRATACLDSGQSRQLSVCVRLTPPRPPCAQFELDKKKAERRLREAGGDLLRAMETLLTV